MYFIGTQQFDQFADVLNAATLIATETNRRVTITNKLKTPTCLVWQENGKIWHSRHVIAGGVGMESIAFWTLPEEVK